MTHSKTARMRGELAEMSQSEIRNLRSNKKRGGYTAVSGNATRTSEGAGSPFHRLSQYAAVDSPEVTQARRISRRIGAPAIAVLLSIFAVLGSLMWLATARTASGAEGIIPLGQDDLRAKPAAVAVKPNSGYVHVVNIGDATVTASWWLSPVMKKWRSPAVDVPEHGKC